MSNIEDYENEENFELENDDIENIDDLDLDLIDTDEEIEEDTDFEIVFKNIANKHKQEGTHSLKRDTIFMGKDEVVENETATGNFYENIYEIEKGSSYEYESHQNEDYNYKKELVKDIYDILDIKTNMDFLQNRRKPNKQTFNQYYEMCLNDIGTKYTKSEIFVELSYYFTDNIFNMFKLLNKKNATGIISELKEKGYLKDIGNIDFI